MQDRHVQFSAHARLKDIVGRGLINDDNVAIIELVKNSKDAESNSVHISFSHAKEINDDSLLIIQDSGQGMSEKDIRDKWLNIAYSDKRNARRKSDNKAYAGSMGIGRFSCDRLGKKLELYTRKEHRQDWLCLEIDWTKFEVDNKDTQIGAIKSRMRGVADHEFPKGTDLKKSTKGTVLFIRQLRSPWRKDKLKKLRGELGRFAVDPSGEFSVNLTAKDYPDDENLNSKVENRIFEELDFRTTSISAVISPEGNETVIALRHDGEEVFRSHEKNPYASLRRLEVKIFFLNRQAKAHFKRKTGYRSVEFGSIFLFLNGFRVLPYGKESDDWLGLDRRKQQGARRFLSTRDVVGHIKIDDREENFQPISSREGLVNNAAFDELICASQTIESSLGDKERLYGFFHKVFRKLERFVVEGLDWDRIQDDTQGSKEEKHERGATRRKIYESLIPTVMIRTPKSHLIDVKLNHPYIVRLAQKEADSHKAFFASLQDRFKGMSAAQLTPADKRDIFHFLEKREKQFAAQKSFLKRENIELTKQKVETERKLNVETKRRLFAEYESTADQQRILQMHHQIGLISGMLFKLFNRAIRNYRKNPASITKADLFELVEQSIFDIDKIRKVSKFASKASFNIATNRINEDLIQFIEEYIESFSELSIGLSLEIRFSNPSGIRLTRFFRPIELTMLIDNLISNAAKASAGRLEIMARKRGKRVTILFVDDGKGLSGKYQPEEYFHSGITTTSGSGIGLRHAKQIIDQMKGEILIENNDESRGATVKIIFEES